MLKDYRVFKLMFICYLFNYRDCIKKSIPKCVRGEAPSQFYRISGVKKRRKKNIHFNMAHFSHSRLFHSTEKFLEIHFWHVGSRGRLFALYLPALSIPVRGNCNLFQEGSLKLNVCIVWSIKLAGGRIDWVVNDLLGQPLIGGCKFILHNQPIQTIGSVSHFLESKRGYLLV